MSYHLYKQITTLWLGAVALGACTATADEGPGSRDDDVWSRLENQTVFVIDASPTIEFWLTDTEGEPLPHTRPTITSGEVTVSSAQRYTLTIEELDLALGDIEAGPGGALVNPIVMEQLHVVLDEPVTLRVNEQGVADARVDLLIEWSLRAADETEATPMVPQPFRSMPIGLTLTVDADELWLSLTTGASGMVRSFGVLDMNDLAVTASALAE